MTDYYCDNEVGWGYNVTFAKVAVVVEKNYVPVLLGHKDKKSNKGVREIIEI